MLAQQNIGAMLLLCHPYEQSLKNRSFFNLYAQSKLSLNCKPDPQEKRERSRQVGPWVKMVVPTLSPTIPVKSPERTIKRTEPLDLELPAIEEKSLDQQLPAAIERLTSK